MAPSDKLLIDALEATVTSIFHDGDRDTLSVKKVRDKTESELGLEQGYFLQPAWKDRSKKIIKEYVGVLAEREEAGESIPVQPEPKKKTTQVPKKVAPPVKKRTQKAPPAEKARPRKRQKKEETPEEDPSELSELSDEESSEPGFGDSDASETPKSKNKPGRKAQRPVKRQTKKRARAGTDEESESEDPSEDSFGDDDEDSDVKSASKQKTPPKNVGKAATTSKVKPNKVKAKAPESGEEGSQLTTPTESEEDTKPTLKKGKPRPLAKVESEDELSPVIGTGASPEQKKGKAEAKANDSESEMSIVLDEPPKPKRRKKSTSTKEPKPKTTKASSSKTPTATSPTDEQLKALQAQLRKCGVRKIWAFELKQFGDDGKAKISHLKDMLRDVGMTGRFSDARAREIKEMRELQADLEAVKEGEKQWGLESGRRARGKVTKSMRISSDDEDEDHNKEEKVAGGGMKKDESESEEEAPRGRVRRANQDLAFLGDEEDSD